MDLAPEVQEAMGDGSEKRAAVLKRGAEREKRDLFATRPPDLGSVKQTLLPPPGGVAARNESSVLFTVAAVRPSEKASSGAARSAAEMKENVMPQFEAAPASNSFVSDDDGVIDLMALSSRPPPPRPAVDPLYAGPLSEPPVGFAREISASSSGFAAVSMSKLAAHKMIVMIAAAALVFLIVGTIGVSAIFSDDGTAKRAAAWSHLPSPKLATASAPVAASMTSEPDDNASSAAGEKHGGKKSKVRRHVGAGKSVITSKSPVFTPAPAPKAADTCGCRGDFNCMLRCSAKGK